MGPKFRAIRIKNLHANSINFGDKNLSLSIWHGGTGPPILKIDGHMQKSMEMIFFALM